MVEIFEPRYHDRTVLVAKHKITPNKDLEIRITKGAYAGHYVVKADDVASSKDDTLKTRAGAEMAIKAIPLDKLEKL